jgi:zinc-ribbon domain
MFCRSCGKQINPSKFCKYCGQAVVLPDQPAPREFGGASINGMGPSTQIADVAECPYCKEEIKPGAVKCKHCGSDLSSRALSPQMDARIREELRKHRYVISLKCLECGYTGPMGLIKQNKPLYQRGWVQGFSRFVPLVGAAFDVSYYRGKAVQSIVQCPSCRKTLHTQNPPVEKSIVMFR